MTLPLVVGVDGSRSSLLALDWAVDEAANLDLPLRIVHAAQAPGSDVAAAAETRARGRRPGVRTETRTVLDDPVAALMDEAPNATALVTGARGHGGLNGLLLGSVSLAVAARAQCPVVVVRDEQGTAEERRGTILLGVADAAGSSEAVRFAFRLADARGSGVDAVCAWCCPAPGTVEPQDGSEAGALLDEALADAVAAHPSVDVRRLAVEGPARDVLLKHSVTSDLLVVGARRRHDRVGLHLGRVNHAMLHYADCPVAVVPQWS
ncbi:universal stress protein [Streptomyces sp. NPDC047928]|uniref:universal stress protein n=1 Tax=unclassified Streptomyces TaxID=2593676 RepID=UPI00371D2AF3